MHKIIHYRKKCIGCGVCYEQQPELWRLSKKDGKATLVRSVEKKGLYILGISAALLEKSQEIAEACPVNVIKVL